MQFYPAWVKELVSLGERKNLEGKHEKKNLFHSSVIILQGDVLGPGRKSNPALGDLASLAP